MSEAHSPQARAGEERKPKRVRPKKPDLIGRHAVVVNPTHRSFGRTGLVKAGGNGYLMFELDEPLANGNTEIHIRSTFLKALDEGDTATTAAAEAAPAPARRRRRRPRPRPRPRSNPASPATAGAPSSAVSTPVHHGYAQYGGGASSNDDGEEEEDDDDDEDDDSENEYDDDMTFRRTRPSKRARRSLGHLAAAAGTRDLSIIEAANVLLTLTPQRAAPPPAVSVVPYELPAQASPHASSAPSPTMQFLPGAGVFLGGGASAPVADFDNMVGLAARQAAQYAVAQQYGAPKSAFHQRRP